MLQLVNAGAAHLQNKVVAACDTVTLQHLRLLAGQHQKILSGGGAYLHRDERLHLRRLVRVAQHHRVAADDALLLQTVDTAGYGGAGKADPLGDLLYRHTGVLGQQAQNTAV